MLPSIGRVSERAVLLAPAPPYIYIRTTDLQPLPHKCPWRTGEEPLLAPSIAAPRARLELPRAAGPKEGQSSLHFMILKVFLNLSGSDILLFNFPSKR